MRIFASNVASIFALMLAFWRENTSGCGLLSISKLRWINRDVGSVSQQYLLSANVGSLFARYLPPYPDDQIYLPSRLHQAVCVPWMLTRPGAVEFAQEKVTRESWNGFLCSSFLPVFFYNLHFCRHTYWRWQAQLILACPEFVDKTSVFILSA